MFKKNKYIVLSYSIEDNELRIFGDNKFVQGEIFIKGCRIKQLDNFTNRIAWSPKKHVKHSSS
jgi:hypothetical protein